MLTEACHGEGSKGASFLTFVKVKRSFKTAPAYRSEKPPQPQDLSETQGGSGIEAPRKTDIIQ